MVFDMTVPLWIYPILAWTMVWKGIGAWKSARNGQLIWFVAFFIFNTLGILPIVYLLWFQQDWNKGIPQGKLRDYKKVKKKSGRKKGRAVKKR